MILETYGEPWLTNLMGAQELDINVAEFAVSLLVAILFGLMLKTLYNLYFQDNEPQDGSLARSLVLLTPSLTATFWMIQNSMILSIGLLGSLSFVRFRTPVKRAEDVSFIVIVLAVAIACATANYLIALLLVGILFGYTLLRNLIGNGMAAKERYAIVTFNTKLQTSASELMKIFETLKIKSEFVSSRTYDGITSFVFSAAKVSKAAHDGLTARLASYDSEAHINIFYPNDRLGA